MHLEETRQRLFDTGFLLGGRRRRAAIKALAGGADPAGVLVLADALARHPKPDEILAALGRLAPEQDGEKIAALWGWLGSHPQPALAGVLAGLGWPPGRPITAKLARDVLAAAVEGAAPEVIAAAVVLARALPVSDEAGNDAIFAAWVRTQSKDFARLIDEQQRQPATPAFEALHALVGGDLARYGALKDADGALLVQAFGMAPEPFRARIAEAVAKSPDRALKAAYRRAIAAGALDASQAIENLQRVGDEDGLFERLRGLTLLETLDLCERWATTPARPSHASQRAAVDRAVAAYQGLGQFQVETGPDLPEGMVDLFAHWRAGQPGDADLRADLDADEPFRRARGLYLGHARGLTDAKRLAAAASSDHWPERLIARLIDPAALAGAKADHVLWVNGCAGDASLLGAPIGGSPEDYARHSAALAAARGEAAGRTGALLGILCTFQGAFVASGITLDEAGEATDPGAVELEDAGDVQF